RYLGLIILADRVNGIPYTVEELELLECIGDQVASSLLNLRLAKEIMLGKELEAFQTISAFFVHDLKNAASTLKLTLQNLPVHFDDPDFRQDTLRSIGAQDGWAALSVSDDGCGMTPSFLRDSLFRPFKTTKKKGLGIGMFQSKMIIEAHHGSIRVKSDLGKGTTFQVLLPLTSGKS